jgi:hypothetical protein
MRLCSLSFPWFLGLALLASGCGDAVTSRYGGMPAAFGKANKLMVIADSSWWGLGLGDSVDFAFGAPVLILPAPEPLYDLSFAPFHDLTDFPVKRELRSYLLLSHQGLRDTPLDDFMRKDMGDERLADGAPYTIKMLRNRWATGQLLFYIYGRDEEAVYDAIRQGSPAMLAQLKEHDLPILEAQTYAAREEASLMRQVQEHTGGRFRIPGEYLFALQEDSVLWLRKELKDMSLGLLFQKVPYESQSQFEKEGFRAMHDAMTAVVQSNVPEVPTRLVLDDRYLPMFFSRIELDGQYAMEVRSLWRMEGDVMGGPMISYVIRMPDERHLLLATGFIYGPGQSKREWMQQLEIILRSFSI